MFGRYKEKEPIPPKTLTMKPKKKRAKKAKRSNVKYREVKCERIIRREDELEDDSFCTRTESTMPNNVEE